MREVGRVTPSADAFDTLAVMNQSGSSMLIVEADVAIEDAAGVTGDGRAEVVVVLTSPTSPTP